MKLRNATKSTLIRLLSLLMVLCMIPMASFAESEGSSGDGWVSFILICNEGMSNNGGNVGNTQMVVAMNMNTGILRLIAFTWDSFLDYEGYDVPQKLDMAYRNDGPEETLKVFDQNFNLDIERFLSLNYSNLASLINEFGGVTVDISRAERNALNAMVASKQNTIASAVESGFMNQSIAEMMAEEVYLDEFGPDTYLNGMQAVAFGWLQYDSVYNCCKRELKVVSNLFNSLAVTIGKLVVFYTDADGYPEKAEDRRVINIDDMTDEDVEFLRGLVAPIFNMSYNNLTEEDIRTMTIALARNAYTGMRQGVNIFGDIETEVFPVEALHEYELVAGTYGHLVDKAANEAAMREFLFNEDR